MKEGEVRALVRGIMPAVNDNIVAAVAPLVERITELEKRLAKKGKSK